MRIAQINVVSSLSTGRIAVALCRLVQSEGHRAVICHSRDHAPTDVASIRIGSWFSTRLHGVWTRLTDREGFFSYFSTRRFLKKLDTFKPDLVHLHNLHGYYLHLPSLFAYLKKKKIPVVWTLHDCWAYTGHCAYYTTAVDAPPAGPVKRRRAETHTVGCERWTVGCGNCVLKHSYPESLIFDRSAANWQDKRRLFTSLDHMVLTTPSEWLQSEVKRSFLKDYPVYVMPNGLDLDTFRECRDEDFIDLVFKHYKVQELREKKIILSVAAEWDERKGLDDLIELADKLPDDYRVVAVGVSPEQLAALDKTRVLGLRRTGNIRDLCAFYSAASVYVSASHEETFGMTLVEALACGTQILCYNATAMPEIVTPEVGEVVELGNIDALADAVRRMCEQPKDASACRARAEHYDANKRFAAYARLYEKMYTHSPAYHSALKRAKMRADS